MGFYFYSVICTCICGGFIYLCFLYLRRIHGTDSLQVRGHTCNFFSPTAGIQNIHVPSYFPGLDNRITKFYLPTKSNLVSLWITLWPLKDDFSTLIFWFFPPLPTQLSFFLHLFFTHSPKLLLCPFQEFHSTTNSILIHSLDLSPIFQPLHTWHLRGVYYFY